MTFTDYIQRQKQLIRARHDGELLLLTDKNAILIRDREQIFAEMDGLEGLNRAERDCAPVRKHAQCFVGFYH